ncbi:MAG: tetratricopeptide repeat protein [Methanospirillaceae archaeon]|nr:tetratricopeptide repeat protein [Methanospirillaceae archaeon]
MIQNTEKREEKRGYIRHITVFSFLLLITSLPACCMAETWPYCTPGEGAVPFTVQFVIPDPGAVTGVLWEFGDKETSTQAKTSHTYTKPTIYYPKVTLTIPGGDIVYDFDYLKALMSENPGSATNEKFYPRDYTIYLESDEIATFTSADYAARGESLGRLGFLEEAEDAYKSATGLDSGDVMAWKGYADTLYSLGSYSPAVSAYKRILDLDPSDTSILSRYGKALLALKRYDDAVSILRQATGLPGSTASTWSGYGEALEAVGMRAEAITALEKATSLDSDNASAWLHYGKILADEGRLEEAKTALERSITINGGSTIAWSSYANVLSSLGYDEDASSARRKAGSMNTVQLPQRAPQPQYCSLG